MSNVSKSGQFYFQPNASVSIICKKKASNNFDVAKSPLTQG